MFIDCLFFYSDGFFSPFSIPPLCPQKPLLQYSFIQQLISPFHTFKRNAMSFSKHPVSNILIFFIKGSHSVKHISGFVWVLIVFTFLVSCNCFWFRHVPPKATHISPLPAVFQDERLNRQYWQRVAKSGLAHSVANGYGVRGLWYSTEKLTFLSGSCLIRSKLVSVFDLADKDGSGGRGRTLSENDVM